MAKMSSKAFSKMLLHAAKYPHCAVNGILLGKKNKSPEQAAVISDTIPLFHLNLTLVPSFEIALHQIEAYCSEENLSICGYYHVHSSMTEDRRDLFIRRVMEKLVENYSEKVLLFMVENHKLNSREVPYKTYEYRENTGELLQTESDIPLESGALELGMKFVNNKLYKKLVDFDNHLDDISLDWRNLELCTL